MSVLLWFMCATIVILIGLGATVLWGGIANEKMDEFRLFVGGCSLAIGLVFIPLTFMAVA